MRPQNFIRMLLVPSLMVTGQLAGADDTPPKGQGPTPPAKTQKRPDDPERRKRILDGLSADAKENDRLFQKMVKEDPQDVGAWLFYGWNAAYNLSVETKDPSERYTWVKRGIERFVEGLGHNPTNAELYFNIGLYLQNRIGEIKEGKAFRESFRKDKEFLKLLSRHVELKSIDGLDGMPDNFLAAQRWFEKSISVVEKYGEPKDSKSFPNRLIVYSYPAISQRQYAIALEREGVLGEAARSAWKRAQKMWDDFGEREFVDQNVTVRLKDSEFGRTLVNYDYWKKRCQAEQTPVVLNARQASFRVSEYVAKRPSDSTNEERIETKKLLDEAIEAWAKVDKEHAWLVDNDSGMGGLISLYRKRVLNGKPLPDDFPFRDVAKRWPDAP